jgi:type I restriction enzyme S subunit
MGTGQPNVNSVALRSLIFPLPSYAEQHRIVVKVDQLMKLCDELEARQQKKKQKLVNLNNAALDRLLTAREQDDFTNAWNLLRDNFDFLYTAPETIGKLRQAILQLAVQGKLVPQDPNDEPASVLLANIKAEKERLIKEKKIRKTDTLPSVNPAEAPYELPKGWEWVRLGEIIKISSGDGLTSENMDSNGQIPVYGGNGIAGYHSKFNVDKPTIVIGRVGYYCGSVHMTEEKTWITDNAFITSFSEENIFSYFMFWLLKGTNLKERENATAQPVISGKKVSPIVVGLPPLTEQHRIVAKVDQLMKLCDELEAKLIKSQTKSEKLVEAAVKAIASN